MKTQKIGKLNIDTLITPQGLMIHEKKPDQKISCYCPFKGSSMGLKVHTNSKTTPRCIGHRGVATARYLGQFWIFSG